MTTLRDYIRDILLNEADAIKTGETTIEDLLNEIMAEIRDFVVKHFEID